jgi:hypothetical protein
MLYKALKSLLMILPQSTCYKVLRDRLSSIANYRQSTNVSATFRRLRRPVKKVSGDTEIFSSRVLHVRSLHCKAAWEAIRAESLETPNRDPEDAGDEGADRREWLGYSSKADQREAERRFRQLKKRQHTNFSIEEIRDGYQEFGSVAKDDSTVRPITTLQENESELTPSNASQNEDKWKRYWAESDQ